ncbi:conserved protein of unknown function [Limnospira indica PCC 8005]|uniref:Uncharacterized protein n=1 Tax=Limnospira indica PCC 8005 TaxID=376219 RepID=A0A9P1P035_9CYAN|nr:conserved protein of unknown function [Limnospira indica PCC 8005]
MEKCDRLWVVSFTRGTWSLFKHPPGGRVSLPKRGRSPLDSLIGQWPQSPGHFSPEAFEDDPDLALMTWGDPPLSPSPRNL